MREVVAVVHLDSGLVLDLPSSTPTFDVPAGLGQAGTDPGPRPVGRALARRAPGEAFLLRRDPLEADARESQYLLSLREPGPARGGH